MKRYSFLKCLLFIASSAILLTTSPSAYAYDTGCGNDGDNNEDCGDCSGSSGGSSPSDKEGKASEKAIIPCKCTRLIFIVEFLILRPSARPQFLFAET